MSTVLPLLLLLATNSAESPVSLGLSSEEASVRRLVPGTSARWSVHFVPLDREAVEAGLPPVDLAQGERVEALLEVARGAVGALEHEEIEAALEGARRLLEKHPELPHASWLMAEHHVLLAEWLESRGDASAASWRSRAEALEGARAFPFREPAGPQTVESEPRVPFALRGLASRDVVEWDAERAPRADAVAVGPHHVRVLRNERLLWVGWVDASATAPRFRLPLPALTPCSYAELSPTRDVGSRPLPPGDVSCANWATARRHGNELQISFCRRSTCSAWRDAPPRSQRQTSDVTRSSAEWPRWATFALTGLGAAAAGGLVLWQAGAFEHAAPAPRERWVYEGFQEP